MHRRQLANKQSFHALILIAKNPTTGEANGFYSISGRPVFDVDGEFKGYQGIGRDITRIKLSEQQLARSEERYRLIAENMQDLITLHAANGKLLFVSPSLTSITGLIDDDIIGQSPRKLLHPDDSLWVRRRFALFAARKEAPQRLTYRLRHHDGHYLWLESHISLVFDSHSRLQHIQIASRDVTARREAEIAVTRKTAELAKANKQLAIEIRERQELERNILLTIEMELSKVGLELHDDLGQNLTGIALLSKSLENRLTEKQSESAVDAARISDLVNRTIRHTRMISHGLSPYIWGVDGLSAALSQLTNDINSLGVVACRTHFGTHIDIQDEVVARSLYRIAQEAINNALKHSHAQTITLSLTNERDDIELTIADNGIGGMDLDRGADLEAGNRFHSIRHRCSVIGATLTIKHPKRGGTTVCVNWRPAQTDNDRKLEMEVNQSGMLQ
jgi:PAS domain S-box-containing protein